MPGGATRTAVDCRDWPCGQNPGRQPEARQRALGARGDEPRRTEFDLQGQYFCGELKSGSDDDGTESAWASVAGSLSKVRR
jgi:hypothetical protein